MVQGTDEGNIFLDRAQNSGKKTAHIVHEECLKHWISTEELRAGSRRTRVSQARAIIAARCVQDLGASAAEIARQVVVNTSSVSRAIKRMEEGAGEPECTPGTSVPQAPRRVVR